MIENPILFQTRLEQLEFDDKDDVVVGPLIDMFGHYVLKGEEYYVTQTGCFVHSENLIRYLGDFHNVYLEEHTKK